MQGLIKIFKNSQSIISAYFWLEPDQLLQPYAVFGRHLKPWNLISLVIVTHSPTLQSLNPQKPSESHSPSLHVTLACLILPAHHPFNILSKLIYFLCRSTQLEGRLVVKIRLYCCHHQYHTRYLGQCALIGCMANGVEIFHFVQRLSCFKHTPIGEMICILETVNS